MAKVDSNNINEYLSRLEKFDNKLFASLKKILGKNPSKQRVIAFVNSLEFEELIKQTGLNSIITDYVRVLNSITIERLNEFQSFDLTKAQLSRVSHNAEMLVNTNGRTVLGYFGYQTDRLRTHITSSIMGGTSFEATIENFGRGIVGQQNPVYKPHFFTEANVGTVVNTSYQQYKRAVTADTFADKPKQKYEYIGGILPTSSDECEWLITNQDPKGYTREEIDAGVKTPFIYEYGEDKGKTKIINWAGRIPNYNCPHEWLPLDPSGLSSIKKTNKSFDDMIEEIKKMI